MMKRGLSNIVATVLIILLALAAVAIIGNFFLPSIEKTGTSIDLRTKCINADVKPTSCVINEGIATVNVQLVKGSVTSVIAIVEDSVLQNTKSNQDVAPAVLATKTIPVNISDLITIPNVEFTAKAAAIVSDGTNQETCTESTIVIDCQIWS